MADKDQVNFEANVEKLTATFAQGANNAIEEMKAKLKRHAMDLGKKIAHLPAPAKGTAKELNGKINEIIASETKSLKGFFDLSLQFDLDEKARKLRAATTEMSGSYLKL